MSDQQVQRRENDFAQELDAYTPNLMQALPAHVSVEKFKRVLTTAVGMNPDLYYANRRTFFTAAVRCAADGLLPDGREAALVVYKTKVRQRDPQTGLDREMEIQAVTYMPMVAGIRKRMRNSGDVLSATAEVVYSNDTFRYRLGDDAMIEHEPPALGQDRGKAVGAYAIIKLRSGEVLRDVMPLAEIEAARKQGRATNSLMWTKFWSEGAKKTVLRRCAKAAPQSAELEALLSREEEPPLVNGPDHYPALAAPEPPPQREDYQELPQDDWGFELVDMDGDVRTFTDSGRAIDALKTILQEAARVGRDRLQGCWDDNGAVVEELARAGADVDDLISVYTALQNQFQRPASPPPAAERPRPAAAQPPAPAVEGVTHGQAEMPLPTEGRRVPRDAPPTRAAARPDTSLATGAGYAAPTEEDGLNLPAGPGPTAPTRASPSEEVEPPRQSTAVRMVFDRDHRPNYRTWMMAVLIPAMRRIVVGDDLAWFLSDNDEDIERACRDPELKREFEAARAAQWNAVQREEAGTI